MSADYFTASIMARNVLFTRKATLPVPRSKNFSTSESRGIYRAGISTAAARRFCDMRLARENHARSSSGLSESMTLFVNAVFLLAARFLGFFFIQPPLTCVGFSQADYAPQTFSFGINTHMQPVLQVTDGGVSCFSIIISIIGRFKNAVPVKILHGQKVYTMLQGIAQIFCFVPSKLRDRHLIQDVWMIKYQRGKHAANTANHDVWG